MRPALPGGYAAATPKVRPAGQGAGRWAGQWPVLLRSYGALIGLLLVVAVLGQVGIGIARLLFVAGCFAVATLAYRTGGLGLHVEISIALFVIAPFLRRIVDLHAGFEPSGLMLVGPLLALMAAFPELRGLLSPRLRQVSVFVPYLLMLLAVTYGWIISAFQNEMLAASIAAAKFVVPMLYCVCLMLRPDESGRVLRSAARIFLILGPVIGLYGIAQHLAPPEWDRYWMISSKFLSIGEPEPGKVRVFSTMNSPASFASYAVCGLLLFSFTRSFIPAALVPLVALLPLSIALLLSGVRTAWISAAVALAFCLLFTPTRTRAGILVVCLAAGVAFTLAFTSFGDTIASRLMTLDSGVAQDGSGQDRIHDYIYVLTEGNRYLLGTGLAGDSDPQLAAADGQLLTSIMQFGMVFGLLQMVAVIWAGVQALLTLRGNPEPLRIVAGAIIVGNLAVFLLLAFAVGEIGFLYWTMVGVLTPHQGPRRMPRPASIVVAGLAGPSARPR